MTYKKVCKTTHKYWAPNALPNSVCIHTCCKTILWIGIIGIMIIWVTVIWVASSIASFNSHLSYTTTKHNNWENYTRYLCKLISIKILVLYQTYNILSEDIFTKLYGRHNRTWITQTILIVSLQRRNKPKTNLKICLCCFLNFWKLCC